MIKPAKTKITLAYGVYGEAGYTKESPHAGVDFSYLPDDGIYAPESGTITARSYMGDCGEAAELRAGANLHRFCHASQWYVKAGDKVSEGQLIGRMGSTGKAYGKHLHWILWVNEVRVNGMNYVNEKGEDLTMTPEVAQRFKDLEAQNNDLKKWLLALLKKQDEKIDYIQTQNNDLKDWLLDTNKAAKKEK